MVLTGSLRKTLITLSLGVNSVMNVLSFRDIKIIMFIFRLNRPLFMPAAVLITECIVNHVQPILSIVFSTIFNLSKGEFYLVVTLAAGQAIHHEDLVAVGQRPWGRFLLFQPPQKFRQRFFNIRNAVEIWYFLC
jgi:hypothetical protein